MLAPASPADAGGQTAAQDTFDDGRSIDIVQVEGAIDPVVADLITGAIEDAGDATVVILQIDSRGALDVDPEPIVAAILNSEVPVAVWVGPARARAAGAAAQLVLAADVVAVSPGATVGPISPNRLDDLDSQAVLSGQRTEPVAQRTAARDLIESGVADFFAPTIGDVVIGLDGREIVTGLGPTKLSTAKVLETDEGPRQTANQPVRFIKLDSLAGVQHSLTSPAVAYLLLIVGLALLVFEFYTVGIGLASATGAACVVGAAFGFSHLPVTWWAALLIVVSALGFAVDVQAGHLGFWTGVGGVSLLVGSLFLTGGSSALDVPLWLVALGLAGQAVFMVGGMTVAVRNRFSIPTVGRDSMIGETGEARTELSPEGIVVVRGAPWRARTLRGRPLAAGSPVRVVAVRQLVLEVEPGEPVAEPL